MDYQAIGHFVAVVAVPTLTAHAITALALAFVPPKSVVLRFAASAVTAAFCTETIRRCQKSIYEQSSYADYTFGLAFHTNCYLVLLNRSPPPTLKTAWQKFQWGVNALFSPRMGTQPYRRDPPNMTKAEFLFRRSIVAISVCAFWLWLREGGGRFYPPNVDASMWAPSKAYMTPQILNGTLTLRDVWFRAALAFYAISGSALNMCGAHSICAIIAVGIFDSPLQSWPPLFGDIREAYTLRRWYSHFWHKAMRKAFTIHAAVVTEKCIGFRKHTVAGRSVIVLLSFFFSGVMHTVTSWQSRTGGPDDACLDNFSSLRYFTLYGVFLLLELAVQAAYIAAHDALRVPWTKAELVFWRLVGYCWVAFFLLESTVSDSYKQLHCMDES